MFTYFGYGSNINLNSLKAKGVEPLSSKIAILRGWQLRFNVQHWFKHEGGMGNIEYTANVNDFVEGVVHECKDEELNSLDKLEAYGIGYDRIEVDLETSNGLVKAFTYVGLPEFVDNSCLPTKRYLNLIINGANATGLSPSYISHLKKHPIHNTPDYPIFNYPIKELKIFNKKTLSLNPHLTALNGFVFDMRNSRSQLECLHDIFGGKDMTLFHLKRHDSSSGNETISDILTGNISKEGYLYINNYLHEYAKEFKCVGQFEYNKREKIN